MHLGFKKLEHMLAHKKGVKNAKAIAGAVAHKKYKQSDLTKHQQSGTSMAHVKPKKHFG